MGGSAARSHPCPQLPATPGMAARAQAAIALFSTYPPAEFRSFFNRFLPTLAHGQRWLRDWSRQKPTAGCRCSAAHGQAPGSVERPRPTSLSCVWWGGHPKHTMAVDVNWGQRAGLSGAKLYYYSFLPFCCSPPPRSARDENRDGGTGMGGQGWGQGHSRAATCPELPRGHSCTRGAWLHLSHSRSCHNHGACGSADIYGMPGEDRSVTSSERHDSPSREQREIGTKGNFHGG